MPTVEEIALELGTMADQLERMKRGASMGADCHVRVTDPDYLIDLLRRAALYAEERRTAEWQPIETAPKDGTEIILYCPQGDGSPGSTFRVTSGQWESTYGTTTVYRDAQGRYVDQADTDDWEGWVSMDGGFSEDTMMPTLWQPLPAPPAIRARTTEASDG